MNIHLNGISFHFEARNENFFFLISNFISMDDDDDEIFFQPAFSHHQLHNGSREDDELKTVDG